MSQDISGVAVLFEEVSPVPIAQKRQEQLASCGHSDLGSSEGCDVADLTI